MVKQLLFLVAFGLTLISFGQSLSLGLGGKAARASINFQPVFGFDILTNYPDTLILEGETVKMRDNLSLPIFARYQSKKNWWVQVNYGFETWRLEINGNAVGTAFSMRTAIENELSNSWTNYTGGLDSTAFRNEFYDIHKKNVENREGIPLKAYERIQYNKLSLAFGSKLNRKGKIQFYYGLGVNLTTTSTFDSYQGLVFPSEEVKWQNEILETFPKLRTQQIAPFINLGLEKQNLRIGIDFAFYPTPASNEYNRTEHNTAIPNAFEDQLIKSVIFYGVHLNYTLFSQNFSQIISEDKRTVLDPLVIGKYTQRAKLFQLGASINFPTIHNSGWSQLEGFDLDDNNADLNTNLDSIGDGYLFGKEVKEEELRDFIYLEKIDSTVFVNESGAIDTNISYTTIFFDSGNINSIIKSPKVTGFLRYNPTNWLGIELNIGYQNQTYGITAYENVGNFSAGKVFFQTRKLLYQENFHEVSIGVNTYLSAQLNNISKIGFHLGMNYNRWIPGKFIVEEGGINDGELLEDFHDYFIGEDKEDGENESDEWNQNLGGERDKGIFSKEDYYNHFYVPGSAASERSSYHRDFSDYLFDSPSRRSFFEIRLGIDYYIENLKFTVYAERSVWRKNVLYNDLLSVGMGVSLFFN